MEGCKDIHPESIERIKWRARHLSSPQVFHPIQLPLNISSTPPENKGKSSNSENNLQEIGTDCFSSPNNEFNVPLKFTLGMFI